jgi:ATP-dependent RNA helicase HelY
MAADTFLALVYESRRGGMGEPSLLSRWCARHRGTGVRRIAQTDAPISTQLCRDYGLEALQQPDFGVVDIMDAWSSAALISAKSCMATN